MGPLVHGDYPVVMKQRIASKSVGEGRNSSRLPEFTLEERNTIKGNLEEFNYFSSCYQWDKLKLKSGKLKSDYIVPKISDQSAELVQLFQGLQIYYVPISYLQIGFIFT